MTDALRVRVPRPATPDRSVASATVALADAELRPLHEHERLRGLTGTQPARRCCACGGCASADEERARLGGGHERRGGGRPLERAVRGEMEPAFGFDFGRVRIHTDEAAAAATERLGARAYTVGSDVYFGRDGYRPETPNGRRLLAHELAHVVQNNGAVGDASQLGRRDDPAEHEAERSAERVAEFQSAGPLVQREPVVRRVVRVPDGDVHFRVASRPTVNDPTIVPPSARFTSNAIHMVGEARITGDPGDDCAATTFGFLQTEWVETNRAYYRGQRDADGSIAVRRDRPPARPRGPCQDTSIAGQAFTDDPAETASAACGDAVSIESIDAPADNYPLVLHNATTGRDNFLREAHLEFLFTTVFTNQRPDGRFHHLRSVYWNTRFQHRFTLNDFTAPLVDTSWSVATLGGTGAAAGGIIRGEPADPRTPTFTTAQADNCNAIAANASGEGSEVRVERSRW